MRLLLACGHDGLWEYRAQDDGRRLQCPLESPSHLAIEGGCGVAADGGARLLWAAGRVYAIDGGLRALRLWHGRALTLSDETGCVTMLDLMTGLPLFTHPVGVAPQDFCLLPGNVLAVCGNADGCVYFLSACDLRLLGRVKTPCLPQCAAFSGGCLWVLGHAAEDAEGCRMLCLRGNSLRAGPPLRGAAGAVCADGRGGVWCACGGALWHMAGWDAAQWREARGFSMVRSLDCRGGLVLACDAGKGVCTLLGEDGARLGEVRGEVCQGLLLDV